MIGDASEVLGLLLQGGHTSIAGRLAGAFRNIGRNQIADDIIGAMRAAGYEVRQSDPFETESSLSFARGDQSPYVNRIRLMWLAMRDVVIAKFPAPSTLVTDKAAYLQHVEDVYVTDAYHSLSIEGHRVTAELINRVRGGGWHPQTWRPGGLSKCARVHPALDAHSAKQNRGARRNACIF